MDRCSSRNRIGEKRGYAYETVSVDTEYEYSPFGEVIRSSGVYADANTFCFSTKYLDVETGFYYYGFRYYDPVTGRWLNRDPLGEAGGLNLYGFVGNDPINSIDLLGLKACEMGPDDEPRNVHEDTETIIDPNKPLDEQEDCYNCHSHAWHDKEGDPSDPGNEGLPPRWDNSPEDDFFKCN